MTWSTYQCEDSQFQVAVAIAKMDFHLVFILLLALTTTAALAQDDCTSSHCVEELDDCVNEDGCMDILSCVKSCEVPDTVCRYICGLFIPTVDSSALSLLQCEVDNHCYPTGEVPTVGHYLGTNADAVQNLDDLDFLDGDWWVVKGKLQNRATSAGWHSTGWTCAGRNMLETFDGQAENPDRQMSWLSNVGFVVLLQVQVQHKHRSR